MSCRNRNEKIPRRLSVSITMTISLVRAAFCLGVATGLPQLDVLKAPDERLSKIKQIASAFQKAGSRRLTPFHNSGESRGKLDHLNESHGESYRSDENQKDLEYLTQLYSLMWRGDQLAVRVTFSGDEPEADTKLKSALDEIDGFDVQDCRSYMCGGWCNLNVIDEIQSLEEVGRIDASQVPETQGDFTGSGSVRTQAFAATQIKKVLEKYPELTGAGVKIGIISDSFHRSPSAETTEEDDIKTGDLPGGSNKVKILDANYDESPTYFDEGRAMAQLVYDLVPDAQIVFHSGFLPQNNFAQAIEALVMEGCDIIVDDVRSDAEPVFQLGESAKAASKAAEENGVAYFTSVRNLGSSSWEERGYKDVPCPPIPGVGIETYLSCHDFGNGIAQQRILIFTPNTKFNLFWDDPWTSVSGPPGPQTDLAIFFYNTQTQQIIKVDESNTNGDAIEGFTVMQPGEYILVIAKRSGPSPSIIKWISVGGLGDDPLGLGISATNTETGNAPGTAAVGAASEKQTFSELKLQSFSSRGGIPLIFDENGNRRTEELVLNQPRFVGPDGSFNTFLGFAGRELEAFETNTAPRRFFGTSCSATNIAAVGAILVQAIKLFEGQGRRLKSVKSVKKTQTVQTNGAFQLPHDIYTIMEETAIDMNEPGFDFLTGHGFVNALAAVEAVKESVERRKQTKAAKKKGFVPSKNSCPVERFLEPIETYYFFDTVFL